MDPALQAEADRVPDRDPDHIHDLEVPIPDQDQG